MVLVCEDSCMVNGENGKKLLSQIALCIVPVVRFCCQLLQIWHLHKVFSKIKAEQFELRTELVFVHYTYSTRSIHNSQSSFFLIRIRPITHPLSFILSSTQPVSTCIQGCKHFFAAYPNHYNARQGVTLEKLLVDRRTTQKEKEPFQHFHTHLHAI